MRGDWSWAIVLGFGLFLTCSGPEDNLPDLTLDDIKEQYHHVDSLNALVFQNQLDITKVDRHVVLGKDIRNGTVLVRRGEKRLSGCIMYPLLFGLFYEECDSSDCSQIGGIRVIDHEGIAGIPRYVGCAPDTSL